MIPDIFVIALVLFFAGLVALVVSTMFYGPGPD